MLRLPSAVLGELTGFGSTRGQVFSAPKGSPGVIAPVLTLSARLACPSVVMSLLLSSSFAMKSETGATRPFRTTYFCILVPDGASRTIPTLFASPDNWPGIPASSPGVPWISGKAMVSPLCKVSSQPADTR